MFSNVSEFDKPLFIITMGRRHGANCTNGSVYTYHEKAKDKRESGWGSKSTRLGKDSIKVIY